jgi:predicted dehydrogenase
MIKAILVGAGARGADAYAPYALQHPEALKFVAVAEPNDERRLKFCDRHTIDSQNAFVDYKEALSSNIEADLVLVCTQDKMHYEPTILALENGYDVLLEKPINSVEECIGIESEVSSSGKNLTICHVLRYTPFFIKIKELIESGVIGELISITHNENVGYAHAAHSYVRGNWRNTKESSPMLLAKSCHDIDILMWLVNDKCKQVSSFGSLKHFVSEKAPIGSSDRCVDCGVRASCPYNALDIYMDMANNDWPVSVITSDTSKEGRMMALKEGPYGRCVYRCDNDVVDHQAVILEFENGVTASFHMNSFTHDTSRNIKICGSKGELIAKMEESIIELYEFNNNNKSIIDITAIGENAYGHGGGDYGIMSSLVENMSSDYETKMTSDITSAVESHFVTFAIEEARTLGSVVKVDEFIDVAQKTHKDTD